MVFSSNIFLFLFLPLFLAVYYLTPNRFRLRNWVVLIGSYTFYAWWRVDFLLLFFAVTVWNYLVGIAIARNGVRTKASRYWLTAGVAVDLACLGYFKYANFGVDSFNTLLSAVNATPIEWTHVILPIGISFYTFESISYIADVYRGDTEATRHPVDFAAFVALFPHLIAGPVFRYKDLADQFEGRIHSIEKFGEGCVRFMQGFICKVLIADSISPLVSHGFALQHPSSADAWLAALAFTAQLYFDFSGYSAMAIGLGLMMGFRFVENFNMPYVSLSITEFWRRWHMSLSSWLRDYLYISLGGNRGGTRKTYRNLFLTMLLGGLWHGANWTYVMWGAWHGMLLCIERVLGVKASEKEGFSPLRWSLTFLFVILGWVAFRADGLTAALHMYEAMFSFRGGLSESYRDSSTQLQIAMLVVAGLYVGIEIFGRYRSSPEVPERAAGIKSLLPGRALLASLTPLFLLAIFKLSAQSYSPFLYFQF